MNRISIGWTIAAVVLALAALAGCTTGVQQLKSDPQRYGEGTVWIGGTVRRVYRIPLTEFAFYTLEDRSGSIAVFAKDPPAEGSRVRVPGRLVYFSGATAAERTRSAEERLVEALDREGILSRDEARKVTGPILRAVEFLFDGREVPLIFVQQGG